jgi:DNA invertase Pin-like site-specific DNA recombinase
LALIGYARVSTSEQDTALQQDALSKAGATILFVESGSGVGPRPELQRAIASLRSGDCLVVWKLDRMARSLSDLLTLLGRIRVANATIKSLTEPIDTSSPIGEFTFQILGAVAQLERSMIRERVVAGQRAAMDRGKRWGPKSTISPEDEEALVALFAQGGYTMREVGAEFGVTLNVAKRVITKRFPPALFSPPGRAGGRPRKRV